MSSERSYDSLVDNRIYMGGAKDVEDMVKREGVSVIVDLREEAAGCAYPSDDVKWIKAGLSDEAAEVQAEELKTAIDQVIDAYNRGEKVGFHCGGGKGRTGAVAVGTLLKLGLSRSLEEAEQQAKSRRPVLNVKPKQREALELLYPAQGS
ncbi:protein tyrosine phosphatase [Paenibacillus sambharensis]|uniref:Protein tyrosine phosphatase n=1 Tax=Paenibacillus sambharensis TaxID=1803190 RepID=A0A2W1LVX2_9BACL|nr:dual specificity protein phosphatase family protein [Paenibacillus sambharensis]PZD95931.1 protein tyrosine phosphatase [Paenibacillus sambharensis]